MKKVGIITFHAAHNYGSNLQAFSLQKAVSRLGFDCEIINFRTERQKDQYRPLTQRKGLKYLVKNTYFLLNYKSRKKKYNNFENFINSKFILSKKEYNSLEELTQAPLDYDYYISGSDQIWNTTPNDADDSYFLPFVKSGKKIAYAPSFGQFSDINHKEKVSEFLSTYDVLSTREEYGEKLIMDLIGKQAPVMPDPTLLTPKEEWEAMIPNAVCEGDYMFFYTLFASKEMIDIVKTVSKNLNLPVVISNVSNQYEIFSGFKKIRYAGPLEFLSLLKNAKFVCVTSFHGAVFSILLHKPFFAINGLKDNRINTLLESTGLLDRAVTKNNLTDKLKNPFEIDFVKSDEKIFDLRKKGEEFLSTALEVEDNNDRSL